MTSITVHTRGAVNGGLLAQNGAVTLDGSDAISVTPCDTNSTNAVVTNTIVIIPIATNTIVGDKQLVFLTLNSLTESQYVQALHLIHRGAVYFIYDRAWLGEGGSPSPISQPFTDSAFNGSNAKATARDSSDHIVCLV